MVEETTMIIDEHTLSLARQDARRDAMQEAIRIIETHRISGYLCSCGSEVNAEWAHHANMIQRSLDERGGG
jgi:hypothetical protein